MNFGIGHQMTMQMRYRIFLMTKITNLLPCFLCGGGRSSLIVYFYIYVYLLLFTWLTIVLLCVKTRVTFYSNG